MSAPDAQACAKEIFLDALDHAGAGREAFVRRACGADTALLARVHALLGAHASADARLGSDPFGGERLREQLVAGAGGAPSAGDSPQGAGAGPSAPASDAELRAGADIGPYRLLGPLGEGGFGSVWRAAQEQPVRREVALKVLKAVHDSRAVTARFAAESDVLARMDHPGIARVLDAGVTPAGRPFFALELVDGPPITDYCRAQALPLRERLKLVIAVARAVEHAHRKGVLHRDLKPGNILVATVDGRPRPMVIDFGIAKAVADTAAGAAALTAEGHVLGTPASMAPEQLSGARDVDTRADVWGLSVVLYELVAGEPPFDPGLRDAWELQRRVREDDPARPSLVRARLDAAFRVPTDVDWIVLRGLEKDRERRYASVAALAEDIQRFLDQRPVNAAPPSTFYRTLKLVRRHRSATAMALVALLALCVGLALALGGLAEARRQAAVAQGVTRLLVDDVLGAAVPAAQPAAARELRAVDLLRAARARLRAMPAGGDALAQEPAVLAAVHEALGRAWLALGELPEAEAELRDALDFHARADGAHTPSALLLQTTLAEVLRRAGRLDEASRLAEDTLRAQHATLGPEHPHALATQSALGLCRLDQGRTEEARALLGQTLAAARQHATPAGAETDATEEAMAAAGMLALAHVQLGAPQEAEPLLREVLAWRQARLGPTHPDTLAALTNLAGALRALGRLDEAEPLARGAADGLAEVLGPEHPDALTAAHALARLHLELGHPEEAETLLRPTLARAEARLGAAHPETLDQQGALGRALELQDRHAEAEAVYRAAWEAALASLGDGHPVTLSRGKELSSALYALGRLHECEEIALAVLAGEDQALGDEHPSTLRSLSNLAILRLELGDAAGAEALLRDAWRRAERSAGPDAPLTLGIQSNLAGLLVEREAFVDAEALARDALGRMRRLTGSGTPTLAILLRRHGAALLGLGRGDEAQAALSEAVAIFEATLGATHPEAVDAAALLEQAQAPPGPAGARPADSATHAAEP